MRQGSCLCGAVRFEVNAELADPITCHCKQCRQQSGNFFSAIRAPKDAVKMTHVGKLTWYRSSDFATRGFCKDCGSKLFWRADEGPYVMVAMASLSDTQGLNLSGHYWVDFKGDYYEITDKLPQHRGDTP